MRFRLATIQTVHQRPGFRTPCVVMQSGTPESTARAISVRKTYRALRTAGESSLAARWIVWDLFRGFTHQYTHVLQDLEK